MSVKIDNRRDILLLLFYSPGVSDAVNEPIVGRTRIVKMLFLFQKEAMGHFRRGTDINDSNFYEFFAWKFGPFSRQVYDDLTFFTLRDFIAASETSEDALPESATEWEMWLTTSEDEPANTVLIDYAEESFSLTEKGAKWTSKMYASLTSAQKNLLREFKKRINRTPLRALLRYVYEKYPDMTEQSQIKDQVLGARKY